MNQTISSHLLTISLLVFTAAALGQNTEKKGQAQAQMINTSGESVGLVSLRETPHGTLLHAMLHNLPAGAHAFHIHTTGKCEAPFKSAGGHFNPEGMSHGTMGNGGMHAGDMPNIHVQESGNLVIEILNTRVRLDSSLFDEDGAAIVIHEGSDDYASDPAGDAGPRIACGVIQKLQVTPG